MSMYPFTVFTPTFNRAHTLPRVWASLQRQSFREFEWVIVDDGSTDNTSDLIPAFREQSAFPVVYLKQPHGHKKAAFNLGVRAARGELFLTLDSDDECVPQALERLWWHWNNIPDTERPHFSAVTALCTYPNGTTVGNRFPGSEWFDSDSIEIVHRWKMSGEKWGFQRTDVLRQFPFPEHIDGFVPEGVVWVQIALYYKTRFINEALRIYHQSPDALTRGSGPRKASARGTAYWMDSTFRHEFQYFRYHPKWFIRCAINFTRFHLHAGDSPLTKAFDFDTAVTALLLTAYPLGRLAYLLDRSRE